MEFNLFQWNSNGIFYCSEIQWNSTRHFLWGMATEFCSTKYILSAAEASEAMFENQPIFMQ